MIGILVMVHEGGHFFAARRFGIRVEEFGFGLPPKIKGYKKGDTVYSLNWLPIGGFVKIKGEDGVGENDPDSFANKKIWQRATVLVAGVAMNFVLAAVIFGICFMIGFPQELGRAKGWGVKITDQRVEIMGVVSGSAADVAGIKPGDVLANVNGVNIETSEQASSELKKKRNQTTDVTFKQDGKIKTTEVFLGDIPGYKEQGLGVELATLGTVSYPFYVAFWQGFKEAVFFTKEIVIAFYDLFRNLIVERQLSADVSGPIGMAVITAKVVRLGLVYILQLIALISINLAILNLLPFPALDGGRLLFLVIEKARGGKPVNRNTENFIHNIGFSLLLVLMVVVAWRDISIFGGRIWEKIIDVVKF